MLPYVLLAAFMATGLASIVAWRNQANRMAELPRVARAAGLSFSAGDPFDSARVPFQMFRMGDGHEVENTMWGTAADGAPVRVFDYSYYVESKKQPTIMGVEHVEEPARRYRHFTCALTEVAAVWPHLVISPERGVTKWLGSLDSADIEFESGEFNRTFRVTCEDERFAQTFIDAQMIEFLLSTEAEFQVEVRGRWVLVTAAPTAPRQFPGLMHLSNAFRATIPPLVWDLYPQGPRRSLDGGMV